MTTMMPRAACLWRKPGHRDKLAPKRRRKVREAVADEDDVAAAATLLYIYIFLRGSKLKRKGWEACGAAGGGGERCVSNEPFRFVKDEICTSCLALFYSIAAARSGGGGSSSSADAVSAAAESRPRECWLARQRSRDRSTSGAMCLVAPRRRAVFADGVQ